MKQWITVLIWICLSFVSLCGLWQGICIYQAYAIEPLTDAALAALDLSEAEHLMIVAHPDDETIWGGGHLAEKNYFVVCITHGKDATRRTEFQKVMESSENVGLMLAYPDKIAGRRDDWTHICTQLQTDLKKILTWKTWKDVVTHNADGEYGHIHHKLTHQLVTQIYDAEALQMPLHVFGKYYTADAIVPMQKQLVPISETALAKKSALLQLYPSQKNTIEHLSHMNPYEMWQTIRGGVPDHVDA